jgi:hypothetical protein
VALLIYTNSWAGQCPSEVAAYCGKWTVGKITDTVEKSELDNHISAGHKFDIEHLGSDDKPNLWISPNDKLRDLWIGQDRRLRVIRKPNGSPGCVVATIKLRTGHGFFSKRWHQIILVEVNNVLEIHWAPALFEPSPDSCPEVPDFGHAGRAHASES